MKKVITIASVTVLFASTLLVSQAQAVASLGTALNTAYPGKNLYTGSCLTCHANTTGDVSVFYNYGNILRSQGVSYESTATFLPAIQRAGLLDYDNDGFTIDQEVEGGSFSNGGLSGNPARIFGNVANVVTDPYGKAFGLATAPTGVTPATLDTLSSTPNNALAASAPYHNIVGGIIEYTLSSVATTGAVKLLFNTGGIQTNPSVSFVDNYSATTLITASTADGDGGSWVVGADGSIVVTITDNGAFDLYSSTPGSAFYDPYAAPSIIQTRLAITTTSPTVGTVASSGDSGGDEGGLHCMTSGLNTYGFMLFGLLAAGLLAKRKRS